MKQLPKVTVFHILYIFFGVEVFATLLRPLVVVLVTADGQLGDGQFHPRSAVLHLQVKLKKNL